MFLVPELGAGNELSLTGAEAHHAAVVRRLGVGEVVLVADGRGAIARSTVRSVARDRVLLTVLQRWVQPEPSPRLVVVQALAKGERAELAVEVLTELGVDEIVPWSAARSVSVWRDDKADKGVQKWRRIALEASKQSRRARIPLVAPLASTAEVTALLAAAATPVVLHEDAEILLSAVPPAPSGDVIVVVGPEGGISSEELVQFAAVGADVCKLGAEVLRTSTAGAAALAVLSVSCGRWR